MKDGGFLNQNKLELLQKKSGLSRDFFLYAASARTPAILNFRLKNTYREAGLCDADYNLTDEGRDFFDQLDRLRADERKKGVFKSYLPASGYYSEISLS